MRFDLTDEQRSIKSALRDICAARCDSTTVRRIISGDDEGTALWQELARAGWTGLAVAEAHGGHGLGILELSLAVEELGYSLAPAAYLGTVSAGVCLSLAGSDDQRRRWLPGIASGTTRAALGMFDDEATALVLDADRADLFVLAGNDRITIVEPTTCKIEPTSGVDITRHLSRVTPGREERLAGDVGAALDAVEVLVSAELLGAAQHAMELAVEHAKHRQQFGRPIGAYQAVSHRCAEMLVAVEGARSAVLAAGWTADNEPSGAPFAASVAKAAAATAAWRVTSSTLQVHGGIGFTWEHDVHLFLRRASASAHLLGSVSQHLDRLAGLSGLDQVRDSVEVPGEAIGEPLLSS